MSLESKLDAVKSFVFFKMAYGVGGFAAGVATGFVAEEVNQYVPATPGALLAGVVTAAHPNSYRFYDKVLNGVTTGVSFSLGYVVGSALRR